MALAPAIDVISPYLMPPSNAEASTAEQPELAGAGFCLACAMAAERRVEPSTAGAGSALSSMLREYRFRSCTLLHDQFRSLKMVEVYLALNGI